MQAAHAMPFGATLLPDGGGVDFRLWAPTAARVELLIGDEAAPERIPVVGDGDGWCAVRVATATAGTPYRWWVGGEDGNGGTGVAVPDPASRFNPSGPHGPSVVVDPSAFIWDDSWSGRPWHEAVIYELHVGAFTPEGTYAAAEARLPALADLGITAVELMPIACFPGRHGWGYDGVLPYAPHAAYGDPQALKHFIQAAHRLGLQVLLDVVYNHFGPDGNYLHAYAKRFFSLRHHTAWGDAINFDGDDATPVREFFIHNALYWLEEYRFDGLRFDAVHAIVDDGALHILKAIATRVRAGLPAGRHAHLVLENEHHESIWLGPPASIGYYEAQWNDGFHHAMHVVLTGESHGYYEPYAQPAGEPIAALVRALSRGYAKEPVARDRDVPEDAEILQMAVPADVDPLLSGTVNFLQNHDQIGNRAFGERLTQLIETPAPLRLAMAITLLGPAPPMLFMGEEWHAQTPFLYFADWQGPLRDAVREGRLREFAAFAKAAASRGESLPDACDESSFLRSKLDWAEAEAPAHSAWREWIRSALAARRRWIEPQLSALRPSGHPAWIAAPGAAASVIGIRWRFAGGRVLELRANLSPEVATATASPHSQPLWPPLQSPQVIFAVGETDAGGGHDWAPWSGIWMVGHERDAEPGAEPTTASTAPRPADG